jgi:hypothetical protein
MSNHESPYRSYLLRLWVATYDRQVVWRASLEDSRTGDRLGFSTLERLFAFLQDQYGQSNERADLSDASEK